MVDMGTKHSVVTQPVAPLSKTHATVIRAMENWTHSPFLVSRRCNLVSHEIRHEFLYLPNCPVGLMGRVLLCKLRIQITFDLDGMAALKLRGPETRVLTSLSHKRNGNSMPLRKGLLRFLSFPSRFQVYGLKIIPRSGLKHAPVVVELKWGATPISQKQYFIPCKAQVRIQKYFDRLLKYGIL
jgi:hypothetical protein